MELLRAFPGRYRAKQRERAAEAVRKDVERLENGLELASLDKYLPLLYPEPATIFDYFPDAFLFVSEYTAVRETGKSWLMQIGEDVTQLMEEGVLCRGLDRYTMEPASARPPERGQHLSARHLRPHRRRAASQGAHQPRRHAALALGRRTEAAV